MIPITAAKRSDGRDGREERELLSFILSWKKLVLSLSKAAISHPDSHPGLGNSASSNFQQANQENSHKFFDHFFCVSLSSKLERGDYLIPSSHSYSYLFIAPTMEEYNAMCTFCVTLVFFFRREQRAWFRDDEDRVHTRPKEYNKPGGEKKNYLPHP